MSTVHPARAGVSAGAAYPLEVSISLVDALYKDGETFLVGTVLVTGPAFILYWKTGDILLLGCALAIALVASVRGLLMYAYSRRRPAFITLEDAKRWERRYLTGATLTHSLLGIWCFIAFTQSSDPFVYLFSSSVTIIYAAGIFGRNFANQFFVFVQIFCVFTPMAVGLLLYGNYFYWIYAGFLALSFLGIKFMADRLRRTLFDATTASRNVALLAERFDAALNNMPHGLCMFDSAGTIVVSNERLSQLLELPNCEPKGLSLRQLFAHVVQAGLVSDVNAKDIIDRVTAKLAGTYNSPLELEMGNGRVLEFTLQHMDNGGFVFLAEDITERKAAEAEKDRLARFDSLTGLPNRVVLRDRMAEALRECQPNRMCAIHFIDLDQFKQVNDTLGHTQGDMLLAAVAKRLIEVTRGVGVIARFGGDEFVILQAPITSRDQSERLAAAILSTVAGTYDLDGHKVLVTASIGIAMADGQIDTDQFLRNADMALYRAKAEGRGTWRWFESGMEVRAQARRSLEFDLRDALDAGTFELHYQPLFNLKTRGITTCEALLRWPHPIRGMVPAGEFIPLAEEMGLIVEIGKQVLNKACRECLKWPAGTSVAVNLSSIQFSRSDVPALVREALVVTGLSPSRLEIEITESTLLQDTTRTRHQLDQLERMGVKISLDDFGTAYSSLSYLHSFPFHKVKIDQSFIRGLVDDERKVTLLRGITRLSAQLGLHVVVEGVETEEQFQLLLSDDTIGEVQGYLLCRPLPARDIRRLLRVSRVRPTGPWFAHHQQDVA
ncbi:MAG TPA: EAL domain-containing protein [Bradyrhizobium sp.]|nr:EAL domain-containing protein [Bradyrhizobium sp.]